MDPYWEAVRLQIEAQERLRWAYFHRVAMRDLEASNRAKRSIRKAFLKRRAIARARKKSA